MLPHPALTASLIALLILPLTSPAHAIANGQLDDFQDATLQGWHSGVAPGLDPNPNPPLVGPICGPSGECGVGTDHYALVQGSGIVPGMAGRGVVIANGDQWAGDYLSAGVTSIRMDVNNLGSVDLNLRLSIISLEVDGGTFTLTESIDLDSHLTGPAGWTTVEFDLDPANWTATQGMGNAALGVDIMTALGSVSKLRLHSTLGIGFQGDSLPGVLAFDNVTAIPEPGTFALVAAGLTALGIRRRPLR